MAHIAARATRGSHIKVFGPPKFPTKIFSRKKWWFLFNADESHARWALANRANVSRGLSLQTWSRICLEEFQLQGGPPKKTM